MSAEVVMDGRIRGMDPRAVFERSVPFSFERHSFYEHKKASMSRVEVTTEGAEVQPDKNFLRLRKRLIESPALNAIRVCDGKFRDFLRNEAAIPWRPALYLVPIGIVGRVAERARAWETERQALVEAAAAVYEREVAAMPAKLGPLFNAADYPTVERFKQSYWVEWRFIDMGVPGQLRTIDPAVFARELAKLQEEGRKAAETIRQHLRVTLLEITDHLVNLLTPRADGKFRTLRKGALDDLNRYLDTIGLRDATNDEDLQTIVARLKAIGRGGAFDPAILREDVALRQTMASSLDAVKHDLSTLVVDAPSRLVRFRDEEGVHQG